ncbi:MBL fold metallo-hydrolase [Sphingobacterium corticibacter]|uniref:MBL fold hydrolase n=1 Tax=Sphingobacterium corticibacter TaxID=2171749 RepID=A0A2T8HHH8_9SPHI|nr:MBL fold metallo-hydrolase [Sphingobacterium corticibacter]PVH24860.1 MBL fold hydrolase [Sphingobacterium corticibacter]
MIQAHSLYEGSFSVDASKVFVPFDPEKDDPKDRPASLFVHVRPFLVETSHGLVVIDAGLGERTADDQLLIHHNIEKLGFDPADVKYVLMSHLHKDHMGGVVDVQDGSTRITFPNAEYIVQEKEWEAAYSSESASYRKDLFRALQRSGNLVLVDGDGELNDEISYVLTGGHSEFHQVFHIRTGGEHYFFGGDVLSEPGEIFRNFVAKYDFDGKKSRDLRTAFWEKGAPEGWLFLFYHSKTIQIGRPEEKEDGTFKLIEVAE